MTDTQDLPALSKDALTEIYRQCREFLGSKPAADIINSMWPSDRVFTPPEVLFRQADPVIQNILTIVIPAVWSEWNSAHDHKQVVAAELERLVERAFPDGEESDYHYGCEALLEDIQARIAELRPTETG